jgi:hypothetical protein
MLNSNKSANLFDGRIIIVVFLLLYFGILAYYAFFIGDYTHFWYDKLGVPAMRPIFVDLDVVSSGCETFRHHIDPLVQNPFDDYKRPMNYPRVWLLLSYIGFGKAHTFWTGIILGVLFFTVCLSYVGSISRFEYQKIGLYIFVFCSPVVMLLVERGNIDIVIFALVALSIKFRNHLIYFLSIIFFASILKLYPLCLFLLGWRNRKSERILFVIFGLVLASYFYLHLSELLIVSELTPRHIGYSYGRNVIFMFASKMVIFSEAIKKQLIDFFPIATVIFTVILAGITALKVPSIRLINEEDKLGFGFLAGALIYGFTFIIGNNYDYRLAFLIFTVPMLINWYKGGIGSVFYKLLLFAVLFLIWSAAIRNNTFSLGYDKFLFLLEEACSWFIFYGFACVLFKWIMVAKFGLISKVESPITFEM